MAPPVKLPGPAQACRPYVGELIESALPVSDRPSASPSAVVAKSAEATSMTAAIKAVMLTEWLSSPAKAARRVATSAKPQLIKQRLNIALAAAALIAPAAALITAATHILSTAG
jgi:hypothetical protein